MLEVQGLIGRWSGSIPVLVSVPTLSLLPISFRSKEEAGALELELRACVAASAVRLAQLPNVHVLNGSQLERLSDAGERLTSTPRCSQVSRTVCSKDLVQVCDDPFFVWKV